jgi:hypothetical protein
VAPFIRDAIAAYSREAPRRAGPIRAELLTGLQERLDPIGGRLALIYLSLKRHALQCGRLNPEDADAIEEVLGGWGGASFYARDVVRGEIEELVKRDQADADLQELVG